MSMLEKYKLISIVSAGAVNTFRVREIATGRLVLVHQFPRGERSADGADLISIVRKHLTGADATKVATYIDSGEEGDRIFVVTADAAECLDFRQWLQAVTLSPHDAAPATSPSPAETRAAQTPSGTRAGESPLPAASQPELDEFSLMFNSPSDASLPRESPAPRIASRPPAPGNERPAKVDRPSISDPEPVSSPAPAPVAPSPQAPQVTAGPGEFTRMFSASQVRPPSAPVPTSKPAEPAQNAPGEFTVMFSAKGQGRTNPEAQISAPIREQAPPSAAGEPNPGKQSPVLKGEDSRASGPFTQMFKTGGEQTRSPNVTSPSRPSPGSSQEGPGEFTRMMQGYKSPASPPPPPPAALETPMPMNRAPEANPAEKAPGEFTVLFRRPPQPIPSAAPAQPMQPPTPPAARASQPGEYTSVFELPRSPAITSSPAPPAGYPGGPPAAAPAPKAPAYQMPPAAPGPPLAPPAETKKPVIFWVLLMALGCLFLTAVVLVLLLALKH